MHIGLQPDIRPACVEDALAIAATQVASWRSTYPGIVSQAYLDALRVEEFAERWQARLRDEKGMCVHVAERSGKVCGFAAAGRSREPMAGYDGEVYAIYLRREAQHKGLGRPLFWSVAGVLRDWGIGGAYVWVLADNPSLRFYERLGGSRLGQKEIEIGGKLLTEVSYGWADLNARLAQARRCLV